MLVLSRKVNETILIPALGITLQVLRVGVGKVSLGIKAPLDVSILRKEIANSDQMRSLAQQRKENSPPTTDRRS